VIVVQSRCLEMVVADATRSERRTKLGRDGSSRRRQMAAAQPVQQVYLDLSAAQLPRQRHLRHHNGRVVIRRMAQRPRQRFQLCHGPLRSQLPRLFAPHVNRQVDGDRCVNISMWEVYI
jgi:hypothetical protein